jgi:Fic family protein
LFHIKYEKILYLANCKLEHFFSGTKKKILPLISEVRFKQGRLIEKITNLLNDDLKKTKAVILEEETLKTAQIEGEKYNPESVRSSIHKRLGLDYAGLPRIENMLMVWCKSCWMLLINLKNP